MRSGFCLKFSENKELERDADSVKTHRALKRYVASLTVMETLAPFLTKLRNIRRLLEDRSVSKKFQKEFFEKTGAFTGFGLIGSGLIGALNSNFPILLVLFITGGGFAAFVAYVGALRLDEERHIFEQPAQQMNRLLEALK